MEFKEAYELPIGKHVEKKGRFNYLSWCYAVKHLRENFKEATWEIKENAEGLPLFPMPNGFMVCVTVIIDGFRFPQWMPILNNKNKTIIDPNAFEINTSIQRCLTKAIALASGVGLALYAGEDLPTEPTKQQEPKKSFLDYKADAEKCETLPLFNDWLFSNKDKVKEDLNSDDTHKFGIFVGEMKDMFAEQSGDKTEPEPTVKTITCPNDDKECTIKECSVAMECNTSCRAYQNAIK